MTYTLRRLSADDHEVLRDDVPVGWLKSQRGPSRRSRGCRVVLDPLPEPNAYPPPFTAPTHTFPTFAAAAAWLGLRFGGTIQGRD